MFNCQLKNSSTNFAINMFSNIFEHLIENFETRLLFQFKYKSAMALCPASSDSINPYKILENRIPKQCILRAFVCSSGDVSWIIFRHPTLNQKCSVARNLIGSRLLRIQLGLSHTPPRHFPHPNAIQCLLWGFWICFILLFKSKVW